MLEMAQEFGNGTLLWSLFLLTLVLEGLQLSGTIKLSGK